MQLSRNETLLLGDMGNNSLALDLDDYLLKSRYSTIALLFCSLYIFFVFLMYEISMAKRKGLAVSHLLLISAFTIVVSCISQVLELFVGIHCEVYRWTNAVCMLFGSASIYTFLWARQRSLYKDKLVNAEMVKPIRWLSQGIIAGIYVTLISIIPAFVITYRFNVYDEYVCIMDWSKDNMNAALSILIFFFIASTFFQISLLALIVYPFFISMKAPPNAIHKKQKFFKCNFKLNMKQDIKQVLTRLSVATFSCIASTCIVQILVAVLITKTFYSNFFVVDMLINTVASVCSFANWKQRLFPYCFYGKKLNSPQNDETRSPQHTNLSETKRKEKLLRSSEAV